MGADLRESSNRAPPSQEKRAEPHDGPHQHSLPVKADRPRPGDPLRTLQAPAAQLCRTRPQANVEDWARPLPRATHPHHSEAHDRDGSGDEDSPGFSIHSTTPAPARRRSRPIDLPRTAPARPCAWKHT